MWISGGGPLGPPSFQVRVSAALQHAADECEKIVKETTEQAFPDGKFPKTKFMVMHGGEEVLRSFDGLVIAPYAHHKIFQEELEEVMFTLQHRDPFEYKFVLLPNGLYIFEAMQEKNWGPVHPIIDTGIKAPPIALLLLADEILDAINETQKEKEEFKVAATIPG